MAEKPTRGLVIKWLKSPREVWWLNGWKAHERFGVFLRFPNAAKSWWKPDPLAVIHYLIFLCKKSLFNCKVWDSVGICCCRIQFGDLARLNSFQRATETIPLTVQPFCFRSNQDEEVDQASVEQKNLDIQYGTFFAQIRVCKNIWDEFLYYDHVFAFLVYLSWHFYDTQ
jgi:hypothetical protein